MGGGAASGNERRFATCELFGIFCFFLSNKIGIDRKYSHRKMRTNGYGRIQSEVKDVCKNTRCPGSLERTRVLSQRVRRVNGA